MMLDSPEDLIPSMLPAFGAKADSKRWDDMTLVTDALYKARGSVRKFHSSEYIQALANGDICVAVGYSGDVMQAKRRADEARRGTEIAYVVPKEGALMWFDTFAIPKDAAHPAEALAFIDYMMRPDVIAKVTNDIGYANANEKATPLVDPSISGNPALYPDQSRLNNIFIIGVRSGDGTRVLTREFTRAKTGQ